MGIVCENCAWRKSPKDNTGKGCIFSNTKKVWNNKGYNKPCSNYITDSTLKNHLIALLDINGYTTEKEGVE